MQLEYAADNLTVIPAGHFLARKAGDLAATKKLAKDDPVAVVRNILESLDGEATAQQISEWMVPDLFTEPEWKRWWESARKHLKAIGAFSIPAKKTEPIQIRAEGISHADELIKAFDNARQPKQQLAALEEIVKSCQQFKESEKQLQPVIATIENVATRNQKLHPELAFELVLVRDDLLEHFPQLKTTHIGLTLAKLIADEEKRLVLILPKLPAAKEKRVLQTLPAALGERWSARALQLMQSVHGRMVAQIPHVFRDSGQHAQLQEKAGPLVVSWSSLEKRKAEYEELVKKKIPDNIKEISLARSYGDLSENFEYKAAKQMQAVLARRRAELERDLQNARGTSFENPDTSRVSIGTVVTVRDKASKKAETYTILGAWDGDPERNIISYQTAIGQALLGKKTGEVATLPNGECEIVSIEPAPVDKPVAEPVSETEPVSA